MTCGVLGAAVLVRQAVGSDHQQTALTELNPRLDVTDVFAFPGSSDSRLVVGMTIASPIVGTTGAFFDPNALYQIHADNNQDGVADLVIQFVFDGTTEATQRVSVIGPLPPLAVAALPGPISGAAPGGEQHRMAAVTPVILRGALNATLTANLPASGAAQAGQLQVFAGVRDEPFYIDLEQFFRIIPDRRPVKGPLAMIPSTPTATAFRAACDAQGNFVNPGPFDTSRGCAVDFLRGFNALTIVVELPETQLSQGRSDGQIGLWTTISR
ncbi:MAG: DUF4331 family protein [Gemmatimonadaceae bacterium]